jgi:uncharacterized membrane protein
LTRNTVNTIAILIPGNNWNLIHPHAQEKLLEHDPLTFVKATTRTFIGSDGTYLNQLIGVMGFTAITVPGITLISYLTAMFLSLGIAERIKLRLSSSIIAFLILIGGILGILGTLYVTATPVGYPVINEITGRYFVPYLLLLLALIAANTRLRHSQYFNSKVAIVGLVIIGLLFSCLKYQYFIYHGLAYHS